MIGERGRCDQANANWHPKKAEHEETVGPIEKVNLTVLRADDIKKNDRVVITTESGSRYMLRRSKSRNDALMVYKEGPNGFDAGNLIYPSEENKGKGGDFIAQVGESFRYIAAINPKEGIAMKSTAVKDIELRKNQDYYAERGEIKPRSFIEGVRNGTLNDI